jgi:hypothetical protein
VAHSILLSHFDRHDPRLGRHVEHDSRSWNFAIDLDEPKELTDVFWGDKGPILDQGEVGGCVGFTGADILNTDFFAAVRQAHNSGKYYQNKDGLNFYHLATVSDNISGTYPPDDTGSSGLGLAKALKKLGLIKSYQHAFSWSQFNAGIAKQPLALGTLWTNDMFNPNKDGVISVGSLDDSNIAGGHEWSVRGVSYTKNLVLGRNHWNASWDKTTNGQKLPGEFWISIPDVQKLLKNQGDVTRLVIA